jgi:hypothetical protein
MLEPEERSISIAKSPEIGMPVLPFVGHEELDVERRQRCFVERQRAFNIAHGQDNVVDHIVPFKTASVSIALSPAGTASLAGPRIELGAQRESLFQVLDEDPYFGGEPAAGRPERKDRHGSFERRQKTYSGALSQFGGEEPGWRLGYAKMLQHTHPHLFDIARSKDSCWNDTLGSKRLRLHRPTFDKHHGPVTG